MRHRFIGQYTTHWRNHEQAALTAVAFVASPASGVTEGRCEPQRRVDVDRKGLRTLLIEHVERDQADHAAVLVAFEEYLALTETDDAEAVGALLRGHISATDASHDRLLNALDAHIERTEDE